MFLPACSSAVNQAMAAEALAIEFRRSSNIEALRMHAAIHDGQLPRSLQEVTIVPLPLIQPPTNPSPTRTKNGVARFPFRAPDGESTNSEFASLHHSDGKRPK